MSWSSAVDRIPHVYEQIFDYLEFHDKLAAAAACPNWETTIFNSKNMKDHLALKIFRESQECRLGNMLALLGIGIRLVREMISVDEVKRSCRTFDSVIVSPGPEHDIVWEDLVRVLKQLNKKQPIRWAKIDGTNVNAGELTKPAALMEFGQICSKLNHLELVLTKFSMMQPHWPLVFQKFTKLESLVVHNGHVLAMDSVRRYCPQLKKVELINFSLPDPTAPIVFVRHVDELIVDGQVVIERHSNEDE